MTEHWMIFLIFWKRLILKACRSFKIPKIRYKSILRLFQAVFFGHILLIIIDRVVWQCPFLRITIFPPNWPCSYNWICEILRFYKSMFLKRILGIFALNDMWQEFLQYNLKKFLYINLNFEIIQSMQIFYNA